MAHFILFSDKCLNKAFAIFKMMVDTSQLRVVDIAQKLERKVESGKMSPEFLREHCRSVGGQL